MCFTVESLTLAALKYAKHRGDDKAGIEELEKELDKLIKERQLESYYQVSGFSHPNLLVFTNQNPDKPQAFRWGLIPSWAKDMKIAKEISNKTLNCRSETMFEKRSFKSSALSKRCIIYIDAFYEHHHHQGKTYPFRISMKDDGPIAIAGLWNEWTDKETGELINSTTIVTCVGNDIMAKIHNNPKAEGPRMPVILSKERQDVWLAIDDSLSKEDILQLAIPFSSKELKYKTVRKILGKESLGNVPEVEEEFIYPELKDLF